MEKGLAIIKASDNGTKAVFIDQDVIECAMLNAKTKKRIAQAEAKRQEAKRKVKAEKKAHDRRNAYRLNAVKHILIHSGICAAVSWLGLAGMIFPVIWIPAAIFHLCGACLRIGTLVARAKR